MINLPPCPYRLPTNPTPPPLHLPNPLYLLRPLLPSCPSSPPHPSPADPAHTPDTHSSSALPPLTRTSLTAVPDDTSRIPSVTAPRRSRNATSRLKSSTSSSNLIPTFARYSFAFLNCSTSAGASIGISGVGT